MALSLELAIQIAELYNYKTIQLHKGKLSLEDFETTTDTLFGPDPQYQPNPASFRDARVNLDAKISVLGEQYHLEPLMFEMVNRLLADHKVISVYRYGKFPESAGNLSYYQASLVAIPEDPKFYSIAPGIDVIGYQTLNGSIQVYRSARNYLLTGLDQSRRARTYTAAADLENIKVALAKDQPTPSLNTKVLFDVSRDMDTFVRAVPVPEAEHDFTHRLAHVLLNNVHGAKTVAKEFTSNPQ